MRDQTTRCLGAVGPLVRDDGGIRAVLALLATFAFRPYIDALFPTRKVSVELIENCQIEIEDLDVLWNDRCSA